MSNRESEITCSNDEDTQKLRTDGTHRGTIASVSAEARQQIVERRESLEAVAASGGPFSQHAERLLGLAENQTEVSTR